MVTNNTLIMAMLTIENKLNEPLNVPTFDAFIIVEMI